MSVAVLLLVLMAAPPQPARGAWPTAYVADQRLACLRDSPRLSAPLLRRLSVGRRVQIVSRALDAQQRPWVRVAVTRRTRGWMLSEAVAVPGDRAGEKRLRALLAATEGFDLLQLARVVIDHFPNLRAEATALLLEAARTELAAASVRAQRRLGPLDELPAPVAEALMLSDPALDRYNRLGLVVRYDAGCRCYAVDSPPLRR